MSMPERYSKTSEGLIEFDDAPWVKINKSEVAIKTSRIEDLYLLTKEDALFINKLLETITNSSSLEDVEAILNNTDNPRFSAIMNGPNGHEQNLTLKEHLLRMVRRLFQTLPDLSDFASFIRAIIVHDLGKPAAFEIYQDTVGQSKFNRSALKRILQESSRSSYHEQRYLDFFTGGNVIGDFVRLINDYEAQPYEKENALVTAAQSFILAAKSIGEISPVQLLQDAIVFYRLDSGSYDSLRSKEAAIFSDPESFNFTDHIQKHIDQLVQLLEGYRPSPSTFRRKSGGFNRGIPVDTDQEGAGDFNPFLNSGISGSDNPLIEALNDAMRRKSETDYFEDRDYFSDPDPFEGDNLQDLVIQAEKSSQTVFADGLARRTNISSNVDIQGLPRLFPDKKSEYAIEDMLSAIREKFPAYADEFESTIRQDKVLIVHGSTSFALPGIIKKGLIPRGSIEDGSLLTGEYANPKTASMMGGSLNDTSVSFLPWYNSYEVSLYAPNLRKTKDNDKSTQNSTPQEALSDIEQEIVSRYQTTADKRRAALNNQELSEFEKELMQANFPIIIGVAESAVRKAAERGNFLVHNVQGGMSNEYFVEDGFGAAEIQVVYVPDDYIDLVRRYLLHKGIAGIKVAHVEPFLPKDDLTI